MNKSKNEAAESAAANALGNLVSFVAYRMSCAKVSDFGNSYRQQYCMDWFESVFA